MFRGPGRRRHDGGGNVVARDVMAGVLIGGALAGSRAQKQQTMAQTQQQQMQMSAAQAQADAYAIQQQQPVMAMAVATSGGGGANTQAAVQGQQMLQAAMMSPTSSSSETTELIAMKKQLEVVQLGCQQALQSYQQSFQQMKKAQGSNMGAVFTHGAIGSAFDFKRDQEMKRALLPSEQASAKLVDAFKRIPNSLRLKYPTEMSRVGDVPATKLAVGSFGMDMLAGAAFGRMGDTMNDIHRQKQIKQNEQQLQQCMSAVQEQITLMRIVQGRLDSDIANAQRNSAVVTVTTTSNPFDTASLTSALPPVPPPIMSHPKLVLVQAHVVDESNPAIKQHGIISITQGTVVDLVKGDLQAGLGAPYVDYVQVQTESGKSGKISRHVVRPFAEPSAPPPPPAAIGAGGW